MLTTDQERALERFSLECAGRSVIVRELPSGQAIFNSYGMAVLVGPDGKAAILRGRQARLGRTRVDAR